MFYFLASLAFSLAWKDEDRRNGLILTRYDSDGEPFNISTLTPSNQYIIYSPSYLWPNNTMIKSNNTVHSIIGSIFCPNATSYEFFIEADPNNVFMIFDNKIILNQSRVISERQYLKSNIYYSFAIYFNPGSYLTNRHLTLYIREENKDKFGIINSDLLYTFDQTDCKEHFYGSDCSNICQPADCNYQGQCLDGIDGDGRCLCFTGLIGDSCDLYCNSDLNCHSNGKCLVNGTCHCDSGYGGPDCTIQIDLNEGTRTFVGILFFSCCTIGFLISSIVHLFKKEKKNPLFHMMLFLFSSMNLISSTFTLTNKGGTNWTDFLILASLAAIALAIHRSFYMIEAQLKITSPDISYDPPIWTISIAPFIIILFSCIGSFVWRNLNIFIVMIPLTATAIYMIILSYLTLYIFMKEPFQKLEDLFMVLATELASSRKTIFIAAVFFLPQSVLAWFIVFPPKPIYNLIQLIYYAKLCLDILCISCIGLSNDIVLSDLFIKIQNDCDDQFVPMGVASVTEVDNESMASATLLATINSNSVYRGVEKKQSQDKGCCHKCLLFIGTVLVLGILGAIGLVIYIHPGRLVWSFDWMDMKLVDFDNQILSFQPNFTLYNPQRIWVNFSDIEIAFVYQNSTLGSHKIPYKIIREREHITISPSVIVDLKKTFTNKTVADDIIGPGGVMELDIIAKSYVVALNMFPSYTVVHCPQAIRVTPEVQVVGGFGPCEYSVSEIYI